MSKIESSLSKVKFKAFGKVKRKSTIEKKVIDNSNEDLLKAQREQIESEFKRINQITSSKGKSSAVFVVLNKVRGGKKQSAELVAMKDPDSNMLITEPLRLKEVSLNYCVNLL